MRAQNRPNEFPFMVQGTTYVRLSHDYCQAAAPKFFAFALPPRSSCSRLCHARLQHVSPTPGLTPVAATSSTPSMPRLSVDCIHVLNIDARLRRDRHLRLHDSPRVSTRGDITYLH